MNNDRDGTSALLEWWLPRWDTWTLAPSLHPSATSARAAFRRPSGWQWPAARRPLLSRWRIARPGAAALAATGTFAAALPLVIGRDAVVAGANAHTARNLRGRARLAALDAYDARALPAAVIYDPLRKTSGGRAVPLLTMEVEARPAHRSAAASRNPQRPFLAAGRALRHRRDLRRPGALARDEPLGLQVGRMGRSLPTWSLQPKAGDRWQTTLDLPVDASFIGLRGSTRWNARSRPS